MEHSTELSDQQSGEAMSSDDYFQPNIPIAQEEAASSGGVQTTDAARNDNNNNSENESSERVTSSDAPVNISNDAQEDTLEPVQSRMKVEDPGETIFSGNNGTENGDNDGKDSESDQKQPAAENVPSNDHSDRRQPPPSDNEEDDENSKIKMEITNEDDTSSSPNLRKKDSADDSDEPTGNLRRSGRKRKTKQTVDRARKKPSSPVQAEGPAKKIASKRELSEQRDQEKNGISADLRRKIRRGLIPVPRGKPIFEVDDGGQEAQGDVKMEEEATNNDDNSEGDLVPEEIKEAKRKTKKEPKKSKEDSKIPKVKQPRKKSSISVGAEERNDKTKRASKTIKKEEPELPDQFSVPDASSPTGRKRRKNRSGKTQPKEPLSASKKNNEHEAVKCTFKQKDYSDAVEAFQNSMDEGDESNVLDKEVEDAAQNTAVAQKQERATSCSPTDHEMDNDHSDLVQSVLEIYQKTKGMKRAGVDFTACDPETILQQEKPKRGRRYKKKNQIGEEPPMEQDAQATVDTPKPERADAWAAIMLQAIKIKTIEKAAGNPPDPLPDATTTHNFSSPMATAPMVPQQQPEAPLVFPPLQLPTDEREGFEDKAELLSQIARYGSDFDLLKMSLPHWPEDKITKYLAIVKADTKGKPWGDDEIERLNKCLLIHGRDYPKLEVAVGTRTKVQIKKLLSNVASGFTKKEIVGTKVKNNPRSTVTKTNNAAALPKVAKANNDQLGSEKNTKAEEDKEKLLQAIAINGTNYELLQYSLPGWTFQDIDDCMTLIRAETKNKPWKDDEIKRLNECLIQHGRNLAKCEEAVGTRSQNQISALISNAAAGKTKHVVFDVPSKAERDGKVPFVELKNKSSAPIATPIPVAGLAEYNGDGEMQSPARRSKRTTAKDTMAKISLSARLDNTRTRNFYDLYENNHLAHGHEFQSNYGRSPMSGGNLEFMHVDENSNSQQQGKGKSLLGDEKKEDKVFSYSMQSSTIVPGWQGSKMLVGKDPEAGGNIEYQRLLKENFVKYTDGDTDSRNELLQIFLDRFDFLGQNGQTLDEVASKMEVTKAFSDMQELSDQPWKNSYQIEMPYYIEELAYHYYKEKVAERPDDQYLEPMPEAPPLPDLPSDKWSFDETTRVLVADFRVCRSIPKEDKMFLCQMMQRDDITVISEGLLTELNAEKWKLDSIEEAFGDRPFHKFRRFNREVQEDGTVSYVEQDKFISMRVSDFMRYLRLVENAKKSESTISFTYLDSDGKEHNINNVSDVVFYMIDIDMPKFLPQLNKNYKESFKIREILPGSSWCMMGSLPDSARPFMGPNGYLTPGGGYTQFHQDGHGTVDSGHSCFSGFNEVVMLRRLPECHKLQACSLIPTQSGTLGEKGSLSTLYQLPHDDARDEKPTWPTMGTINEWKRLNYYPCVFTLKPGQHVHIGKGRLHAFRKLTIEELPPNDCHFDIRRKIIKDFELKESPLCFSVAFDWMFWGYDKEGINREVASTVECAALCRDHHCKSLAIPETAILNKATLAMQEIDGDAKSATLLSFQAEGHDEDNCSPPRPAIIAGLLSSLRYLIQRDRSAGSQRQTGTDKSIYSGVQLKVAKKPDVFQDPLFYPIDPYGSDYFCRLCHQELSNSYFHCNGCEVILNKDFNICSQCYSEGAYLNRIQMHPASNKWYSDVNHLGSCVQDKDSRGCGCHAGRCRTCPTSRCKACSCRCHKVFTNHFRFMNQDSADTLLRKCEEMIGDEKVKYCKETLARLRREPC